MNRITFLGVWMTPEIGETVSFVVETHEGERVLVDCGTNVTKALLDAGIAPETITHIIITHTHGDHISGLPTYLFYRLMKVRLLDKKEVQSLTIISTADSLSVIKEYVRLAYGALADDSSLIFQSVNFGDSIQFEGCGVDFFPAKHQPPTIAMSWFLSNGKKLTYSGDTALSDCVLEKAQGADVLIHDVVGTSAYYMLASSHTLCDQLSEQLERYQIKCLLPVHRLTRYKDDISDYLEELESNFSGDVIIPNDGDTFEL